MPSITCFLPSLVTLLTGNHCLIRHSKLDVLQSVNSDLCDSSICACFLPVVQINPSL